MKQQIYLSIVIPAYNEADRIVPTLQHTISYLSEQPYKSQVIVVSDGSCDNTAGVVKGFQSSNRVTCEVLEYHPNQGKGYAVRYGMLAGQGDIVMFMDADYAVPINYCKKGIALIDQGLDIAIASRAIQGAQVKIHQNIFRTLSAKLYTLIQNIHLGIYYPDTQCGFKLFKKKAAQYLFKCQKLNSVIFDPEILWLAKKSGFSVGQFAVQWTHIADSRIQYNSMRKFFFVFQELFRIKKLHKDL